MWTGGIWIVRNLSFREDNLKLSRDLSSTDAKIGLCRKYAYQKEMNKPVDDWAYRKDWVPIFPEIYHIIDRFECNSDYLDICVRLTRK